METQPVSTRWYQKGWGIALLAVGVLLVMVFLIITILTARYWWHIKQGRGELLEQSFTGFTQSVNTPLPASGVDDRSRMETSDDPFLGNPNAAVTIVEFVDFKCPNCRAAEPIMEQLVQKYGYKLKLIVRDFPVESIHPGASQLAFIASCAHKQGNYWRAHRYFFEQQDSLPATLTAKDIQAIATTLALDYQQLETCIRSSQTTVEVNKDYADGFAMGARGTPTFFVNGQKVEGVVPFAVWETYLKAY